MDDTTGGRTDGDGAHGGGADEDRPGRERAIDARRRGGLHGRAPRVLVLGGAGFIGRHAVTALLDAGADVAVGSRHPRRIDRRLPDDALGCERVATRMERLLAAEDWRGIVSGFDAVVNCVGILRQRGRETYDRVHHRAPAALAACCRERGIRLVHVSALGLHAHARSRFIRSKWHGERALLAGGGEVFVVRPSLLDGERGFGARWLRALARLPLHVLPADASGRIAALDVRDLGEALATLALCGGHAVDDGIREIELGGTTARPLHEQLAAMRRLHTPRPARVLTVPGWLARAGAHACDLLHVTPFSFGHWELLRRDNCPAPNRLPALLGRAPRAVGLDADSSGARQAEPLPA